MEAHVVELKHFPGYRCRINKEMCVNIDIEVSHERDQSLSLFGYDNNSDVGDRTPKNPVNRTLGLCQ